MPPASLHHDPRDAALTAVLRELFSSKTQTTIATELTELGLKADQTKVSAWTRGRQPTLDQLAVIERWAGKPRGWVLARAGYASMPGVDAIEAPAAQSADMVTIAAQLAALQASISSLAERVERLEGKPRR